MLERVSIRLQCDASDLRLLSDSNENGGVQLSA